jgi:hypothetical protein
MDGDSQQTNPVPHSKFCLLNKLASFFMSAQHLPSAEAAAAVKAWWGVFWWWSGHWDTIPGQLGLEITE